MKKFILSTIILSSASVCVCARTPRIKYLRLQAPQVNCVQAEMQCVKNAEWAEIRGLPRVQGLNHQGWIKIYPGGSCRVGDMRNCLSRMWQPKVYFFDKNGKEIHQENLTDLHLTQNQSRSLTLQQCETLVKKVRSRLTELPKVYVVRVVNDANRPGRQKIQLFNKKGMLIASVDVESNVVLRAGDRIPRLEAQKLDHWVSNPRAMEKMKIKRDNKHIHLADIID